MWKGQCIISEDNKINKLYLEHSLELNRFNDSELGLEMMVSSEFEYKFFYFGLIEVGEGLSDSLFDRVEGLSKRKEVRPF